MHEEAPVHATPANAAWVAPPGAAGVCNVQTAPFHRSATNVATPAFVRLPTAIQAVRLAGSHAKSKRRLAPLPATFGVGSNVHAWAPAVPGSVSSAATPTARVHMSW